MSPPGCGGRGPHSGGTGSPGRPSGSPRAGEQHLGVGSGGEMEGEGGQTPAPIRPFFHPQALAGSTLKAHSPAEWMSPQLSGSMAKFPRARAVRFWMLSVFTHCRIVTAREFGLLRVLPLLVSLVNHLKNVASG